MTTDKTPADPRIKALEEAVDGIADDYMTSEKHHPGYVLIPVAKFERLAALTPAAPAADELPAFEPLMLRGLTFAQALASMRATGCAIRRNHWCAPIVRLVDGRPHLDDEGEVESAPYHPATDDRRAADWEMIPSPELEPDQAVKGDGQ